MTEPSQRPHANGITVGLASEAELKTLRHIYDHAVVTAHANSLGSTVEERWARLNGGADSEPESNRPIAKHERQKREALLAQKIERQEVLVAQLSSTALGMMFTNLKGEQLSIDGVFMARSARRWGVMARLLETVIGQHGENKITARMGMNTPTQQQIYTAHGFWNPLRVTTPLELDNDIIVPMIEVRRSGRPSSLPIRRP